ncbi:MAG: hypothetical protein ACR2IS_12595, partial [Nitrososphaeraceae archaeon]
IDIYLVVIFRLLTTVVILLKSEINNLNPPWPKNNYSDTESYDLKSGSVLSYLLTVSILLKAHSLFTNLLSPK